jgi:periplasmic protein CpxP/Spy
MRNTIATLALGSLLALGTTTAALAQNSAQPAQDQGPQGRGPGRMDPNRQLEHLTQTLSLSSDQQAQIKPLLVDRQQKMEAVFQDQSLSGPDRRAKMQSIRQDSQSKIEAVLNDDQKQKFETMQQQQQMRNRGGNGQGGQQPQS